MAIRASFHTGSDYSSLVRNLSIALASICLIRSRVTPISLPTCSYVYVRQYLFLNTIFSFGERSGEVSTKTRISPRSAVIAAWCSLILSRSLYISVWQGQSTTLQAHHWIYPLGSSRSLCKVRHFAQHFFFSFIGEFTLFLFTVL